MRHWSQLSQSRPAAFPMGKEFVNVIEFARDAVVAGRRYGCHSVCQLGMLIREKGLKLALTRDVFL
jgi:hypothetical protein